MLIMGTRSAANRAPVLQSVNRRDDVLSHGFRIGEGGTRPYGGSSCSLSYPRRQPDTLRCRLTETKIVRGAS